MNERWAKSRPATPPRHGPWYEQDEPTARDDLPVPDRLALSLSPAGHLLLREGGPGEAAPPAAVAARIAEAFERGQGAGLLHLGASEAHTRLPPALGFWRDLGRAFLTALCGLPDLEEVRERAEVPAPEAMLERLAAAAPLMPGGEYLTGGALAALWGELLQAWRAEIAAHRGTVQAWLAARDEGWSLVGRVHLHLAEHRSDEERPFAFLATYTTGLAASGKPQHRPLGEAVRAASTAADRRRLLALLAPVQRASERSALVKELADSGRLFQPQAWTPAEAHRFLLELPALEDSGLVLKVPGWWSGRRPRPRVTVKVGEGRPAGLGLEALLDFTVSVTLDGAPLSPEELRALREGGDGLRFLKGRWVEVDRERLERLLARWREAERAAADGMGFAEAMRLVAGARLEGDEARGPAAGEDGEERAWMGVEAGAWLSEALAELRAPADGQAPVGAPIGDPSPDGPGTTGAAMAKGGEDGHRGAAGAGGADVADPGELVKATLRPYQREGVRWLLSLARLGLGGCLADDMGLGKTLQVLALLVLLRRDQERLGPEDQAGPRRGPRSVRRGVRGPHLLVAPASLLANWKAEAARFAPSLRVLVAHPSALPRAELDALTPEAVASHDLVVVTYGSVQRLPFVNATQWGLVVLDEAQAIKNPGARQTRAVKALRSRLRLALTGTPVENRAGDLWSIFDFVNPGLLGSARAFTEFVKRAEREAASATEVTARRDAAPVAAAEERPASPYAALRALVRPYLLRRLKTDRAVIADLPDKTEVKAYCALSRRQAALYQESVEALARELQAASRGDAMKRRGVVLSYLLRLKQLCNHPSQWLGDGAYAPEESGKFGRLAELGEVIGSRQEKALVFTQFRELAGPLSRFLAEVFGRPGLVLHGRAPR